MPKHSIDSVLAELREEDHPPMVRFVSELAVQPWAAALRYDLSMLRLWISRKDIERVEVMVTYGDGRGGGRPYDLNLDAYETTIFDSIVAVDTVTRNSADSIGRIHRWLLDTNAGRLASERLPSVVEATRSIFQLRDAWLAGDNEATAELAGRLGKLSLLEIATAGLAACATAVGVARPEIEEVARLGNATALSNLGHHAFDRARGLTLAAERSGANGRTPDYLLLHVAESSARVIHNASSPPDPFDDDSAVALLRSVSEFVACLPIEERDALGDELQRLSLVDLQFRGRNCDVLDALTGLPSRRALDPSIADGAPIALLVDLDGLIWLNDQFGLEVGDRALVTIATALAHTFGTVALTGIFRVAGDTFLVVLPGLDDGMAAASRVVQAVRELNIPYRRTDRPERTQLEVNVVVVRLTEQRLSQCLGKTGVNESYSEFFAELIYREKQRCGGRPGVVVDAR